uniref:VP4 n=1 Tax=Cecropis daurica parvoviridae sp. TaxID=2794470 RepID=A0A8E7L4E5_9VIRU|nr:MAG: VP4 [Cecropis daurica parvoviridae sp.]
MPSPRKRPSPSNRGQQLYAYIQKRLGHYWRNVYNTDYASYQQYLSSVVATAVRNRAKLEFNSGLAYSEGHLPEIHPFEESEQHNIEEDPEPPPSPAKRRPDQPSESDDIDEPTAGPSHYPDSPAIPESLDLGDLDFDNMANVQANVPRSMGQTAQSVAQGGAMEVDSESSSRGNAATASASVIANIPPSPRLKTFHVTYHKTFYRYTYGLKHHVLHNDKFVSALVTPYAYYPVDWLPWYISPEEYQSLPNNVKVVHVKSSISLVGTRTAFMHGTSLAGSATTEYVPIVKWAIGLNKKIYMQNNHVNCNSTEPMQVDSVDNTFISEAFKNLYTDPNNMLEVPRHLNGYAIILHNRKNNTNNPYDTVDNTGYYRHDKVLNTAMVNENLGRVLIDYSYSPRSGYIKPARKVLAINATKANGFPSDIIKNLPYNHTVPTFLSLTGQKNKCSMNGALASFGANYSTSVDGQHQQSLETFVNIHPQTGSISTFIPQPQVHLGLLATPSCAPSSDSTDFLNSSLYTVSKNVCTVEFNMDSMCISGDCVAWPDEVRFFLNQKHQFIGQGFQYFGMVPTTTGASTNWEVSSNDEQPLPSVRNTRKTLAKLHMQDTSGETSTSPFEEI